MPLNFVRRLAEANHLAFMALAAHLCDPPGYRGPLSWDRIAAAAGRDPHELRQLLQ